MSSTQINDDFVAVDYHVSGRRSAVDVHLGHSQLAGISLADSGGRCAFVSHNFQNVISSLAARRRVYHDALFAQAVERKYGLPPSNTFDCTRTMSHLLDENVPHDFDELIRRHAGDLAAAGPVEIYGAAPAKPLVPPNSACLPWLLYVRFDQPRRIAAEQLDYVYRQIELPLVEPLVTMAQTGIAVDVERLTCIRESHQAQCEIIRHQLEHLAGRPVELGSAEDIARLLFEELRLSISATTPSGAPSTDREALEPLLSHHPAVDLVMRGRSFQAVASAAQSLLDHTDLSNGHVYANLDPLGAHTGRLSCCEPNLQGLPAPLMESIVAAEPYVLALIDYEQMELRVLANLAQDPAMCDAFVRGEDIHKSTAGRILGLSAARVTQEQRQLGKETNFGVLYGQTAIGLASKLRVSVEQAAAWIATFYRSFPGVDRFVANTKHLAANMGYVTTYFGRRRRLPLANGAAGESERQRALRQAVNAVVQGTAADLNKLALARIYHYLPSPARVLFNIHDAVLLQIPRNDASSVLGPVQALMEQAPIGWTVPLRTTIGVGHSWHQCKHPACCMSGAS